MLNKFNLVTNFIAGYVANPNLTLYYSIYIQEFEFII